MTTGSKNGEKTIHLSDRSAHGRVCPERAQLQFCHKPQLAASSQSPPVADQRCLSHSAGVVARTWLVAVGRCQWKWADGGWATKEGISAWDERKA